MIVSNLRETIEGVDWRMAPRPIYVHGHHDLPEM